MQWVNSRREVAQQEGSGDRDGIDLYHMGPRTSSYCFCDLSFVKSKTEGVFALFCLLLTQIISKIHSNFKNKLSMVVWHLHIYKTGPSLNLSENSLFTKDFPADVWTHFSKQRIPLNTNNGPKFISFVGWDFEEFPHTLER